MREDLRTNPRIIGRRYVRQQPAIEGAKRTLFGKKVMIFPNLLKREPMRKEAL